MLLACCRLKHIWRRPFRLWGTPSRPRTLSSWNVKRQTSSQSNGKSAMALDSAACCRRLCRTSWDATRCRGRRLFAWHTTPTQEMLLDAGSQLCQKLPVSPPQVVKQLWEYIKQHNLQNPAVRPPLS